ncbi:MAG: hypothetical protein E6G27_04220 [Actinobacteria bacterium]|nr:MAG: hypothetical protein E6G27_04220 [Actinomycetota bacterium]
MQASSSTPPGVGRRRRGIGVFAVPGGQVALVLFLGAVVGGMAGLRPARRTTRLYMLAAIATE